MILDDTIIFVKEALRISKWHLLKEHSVILLGFVVSRPLALMSFAFWCHTCECVTFDGKRDLADTVEAANQRTLK